MTDQEVLKIRKDFPWFKFNPHTIYLDSSATSLKNRFMVEAVENYYYKLCTNPHNNDSLLAYQTNQLILESRKIIAKHLNVLPTEIIFTSGATESLNLVAHGLADFIHANDEIILTYDEHASNLLPWKVLADKKKAKLIYANKNPIPTEQDFIDKITKRTKVITFCNISNILGYELDMKKIAICAKKINPNIVIVVDATQAIPHKKYDIGNAHIDFLAFSGHKLTGPTGIGVCYINQKWANKISPIRFGGGMNTIIDEKYFTYASAPDKFEGGTSNIAGIIGLGKSVEYLTQIGWDKIHQHELELKKYINQQFRTIPNLMYYNASTPYPIVFFNMKGCSAQDLAGYLATNNIIVRSGLSCAKLSKKVTHIDEAVRVSCYLYTTRHDIDQLVKVLKKYRKGDELKHVIF